MLVANTSAFGRPEEVIDSWSSRIPARLARASARSGRRNVSDQIRQQPPTNLMGTYGAAQPRLPMTPGLEGVGRVAAQAQA